MKVFEHILKRLRHVVKYKKGIRDVYNTLHGRSHNHYQQKYQ